MGEALHRGRAGEPLLQRVKDQPVLGPHDRLTVDDVTLRQLLPAAAARSGKRRVRSFPWRDHSVTSASRTMTRRNPSHLGS
ncbi:hypothetical protein GCM10010988_41140 [Cnuibacter physcomitrellae]|nr:hypothetical protein GCM10010988_41140 [Cnuibacter physcomitrellae]